MQAKRGLLLLLFPFIIPLYSQSPWYEPNGWGDLIIQMQEYNNRKDSGWLRNNYTNHYFLRKRNYFGNENSESGASHFNRNYYFADNPEFLGLSNEYNSISKKRVLKYFYQYKPLFITYHEKKSWLSLNPIINVQAGPKSQWGNSYSQNTRGVELRGTIEGKVGFYSRILENQWFAPQFVRPMPDSLGVVPGVGWWRYFKKTGYDFFSAKAYINFEAVKDHINVSFGHDRFFIGNGYRSLILSDFAKEYLFLKLNTQLGPFHYQNIFAQLNNFTNKPGTQNGDKLVPKKFMAVHRLSVQATKWLELGATEMIVFDRDSTDTKGFELEYLNPIIFYRAVESNLGSRDNALIALDAKAYLPLKLIFYGQLLVDEFSIKQVKANNGWWANKFGFQAGLKGTYNIGSKSLLYALAEFNSVKPYTYSHYRSGQSWTQYGQPLAHPLGANFKEMVFRGIFQPGFLPKLRIEMAAMFAKKGNDSAYYGKPNYGGDVYKVNGTRLQDYNNKLLQGNLSTINNVVFNVHYMLKHNLYLNVSYQTRMQKGWQASNNSWINVGIRINVEPLQYLF